MGGSSGGGGSGAVDFPAYMKGRHEGLLNDISEAIHNAVIAAPYQGMKQVDPSDLLNANSIIIDEYWAHTLDKADWVKHLPTAVAAASDIYNNALVKPDFAELEKGEFDRLKAKYLNEIIPKYRIGMRDAGVVMTSAYKIGEALLWTKLQEETSGWAKEAYAKYLMTLYSSYPDQVLKLLSFNNQDLDSTKMAVHYYLENSRLAYAMASEVLEKNNEYQVMATTWPLEMRKYFFDALGCIQGAAGNATQAGKVSKTSTAIGGAISGAATGAMVTGGNPVGALAGGAIGLIGGLFG